MYNYILNIYKNNIVKATIFLQCINVYIYQISVIGNVQLVQDVCATHKV